MADYSLEMEDTETLEWDELELDEGNAEEAAEEIHLLVRCVHAARQGGA
jgi:hypothetical protein